MVNVEILHDGAFSLLSNMEHLALIRLNAPAKNVAGINNEKLSKQFAGALKLSDDKYKVFQDTLQEGRSEWARDIY